MLESTARDGHARLLTWSPSEGQKVQLPNLIVPETSQSSVPDWAEVVLTGAPRGGERIELVSSGTWFHPQDATGLVVASPQPLATHQVQVIDVAGEVAVFHDAGGWASNPQRLVPAFIEAKSQTGFGKAFWAPALGTPADYAVWAHLGVDLFDASPLMLAAVRGQATTVDGIIPVKDMEATFGGEWSVERLFTFNLEQARDELARIRHAIKTGQLRALAERRAYVDPATVALLRRFDRQHEYQLAGAPAHTDKLVPCMTPESLWMPAVESFRQRMRTQYTTPSGADVLVLLPCSARKPYRLSKSHRYFARALDDSGMRHRAHEVMVTSPLGLVPRDVEDTYPANRYDVPVTGKWTRDEEEVIREQLTALLARHDYKHVVAHVSPGTYEFIRDLIPEAIHTGHSNSVQSKADCDRLRDTLRQLKKDYPLPSDRSVWQARKVHDVQALASLQFGPAAAAELVAGSSAHGKAPYVKLGDRNNQRGMTTMDRGMLSLTIAGAEIVAKHGTKRVFIENFWPKKTGSLFAVGVTHADADVHEGDDVVVCCKTDNGIEVRGCGSAQMSAGEMRDMKRGVAVSLRHVVKETQAITIPDSTPILQEAN